ncbi:MAG: single-stranded-DNA-specific exonuclease RecJ [Glaciecola sp.]
MLIQRRQAASSTSLNQAFHPILDQVIRQRGISSSEELTTQAQHLLHYNLFKDIDVASQLLANAVINKRAICIVGDFDADGATSTALCILALRAMGHTNVSFIVPNRFDYGYGLTSPVVELAHQQGAELIVTVDNGISSIDGVNTAKALGIEVVVTDHHLPAEQLPAADAIVNPNQVDCDFPSKAIAGVGVAFYVMTALKNTLQQMDYFSHNTITPPNMANFLDIVALGTVADVVALDKNNRILVHQGIARIRSGRTRPGILALLNVANKNFRKCCTTDIGFVLGPRLNAAGRLEDMSQGIECLISDDSNQCAVLAAQLDGLNQSRREIEASMREDANTALAQLDLTGDLKPSALVVYRSDFHQGVVGIVAGRLKEAHYRPTIVFADEDEYFIKGSARSIDGVHIRDALARVDALVPGLIKKFGGHAMAAGLSIAKQDLAKFSELLQQVVSELLVDMPSEAILYSDGELSSNDLSLETASLLKFAMPWGQQFEEPVFDGEFALVSQKIVGQKHLKVVLQHGEQYIDGIAFNVNTDEWPNLQAKRANVAYRLDINEFRGQTSVQLIILGIEALA